MIKQHEPGCWSGFVEHFVVGHVPAYAKEFDEPECLECKVKRGELVPDPKNPNLLIPATPIQKIISKPRAFFTKWWPIVGEAVITFLVAGAVLIFITH